MQSILTATTEATVYSHRTNIETMYNIIHHLRVIRDLNMSSLDGPKTIGWYACYNNNIIIDEIRLFTGNAREMKRAEDVEESLMLDGS